MFEDMVKRVRCLLAALVVVTASYAQYAYQIIKENPDIAASNYFAYPIPSGRLTPPPAGKPPF